MCILKGIYKCSNCTKTYKLWIEHCADIVPEARPCHMSPYVPVVGEFVWDQLDGCKGLIFSIGIVVQDARCNVCVQNGDTGFIDHAYTAVAVAAQRGPYRFGSDSFIDTPANVPGPGSEIGNRWSNRSMAFQRRQTITDGNNDDATEGDADSNVAVTNMSFEEGDGSDYEGWSSRVAARDWSSEDAALRAQQEEWRRVEIDAMARPELYTQMGRD